MSENLSLFGWLLPEPRDKAGRPEHVPTDEIRSKIMLLQAFGLKVGEIAKAIGLSEPTMRKHYFRELEQRKVARLQLDATRWAKLYEKVLAGDVGAMKELGKLLDKRDLAELDRKVQARGQVSGRTPRQPALGKKEQVQQEAQNISGKFAPPAAPARTVN